MIAHAKIDFNTLSVHLGLVIRSGRVSSLHTLMQHLTVHLTLFGSLGAYHSVFLKGSGVFSHTLFSTFAQAVECIDLS